MLGTKDPDFLKEIGSASFSAGISGFQAKTNGFEPELVGLMG